MRQVQGSPRAFVKCQGAGGKEIPRLLEVAGSSSAEAEIPGRIIGVAEMESPPEIQKQTIPSVTRLGKNRARRRRKQERFPQPRPRGVFPRATEPRAAAAAAGASRLVFSKSRLVRLFICPPGCFIEAIYSPREKDSRCSGGRCGSPAWPLGCDAQYCVMLSVFPSGSLNHATRAPLGEVQMASSSCCSPG